MLMSAYTALLLANLLWLGELPDRVQFAAQSTPAAELQPAAELAIANYSSRRSRRRGSGRRQMLGYQPNLVLTDYAGDRLAEVERP